MLAVSIDGYALGAIAIVAVTVVIVVRVCVRLMRDHGVRVARVGIFIERKRVDQIEELWTADPLDPKSETRPAPLPPPTPPPPLPPRADDETQTWPHREEGA